MRQLTSLDAQFLALENSRQTGHVGSLAMLDASTAPGGSFGSREVTRLLEERGAQLPPLRWRLAEVLTKIHHSVIDGLSGAEIMALLLDLTPEGREVPPPADDLADPPPST